MGSWTWTKLPLKPTKFIPTGQNSKRLCKAEQRLSFAVSFAGKPPQYSTGRQQQRCKELRDGGEGAAEATSFIWNNTDHRLKGKQFQEHLFLSAINIYDIILVNSHKTSVWFSCECGYCAKREKIDSEGGMGSLPFPISGTAVPGGIYLSSNTQCIWTGSVEQLEAVCPDRMATHKALGKTCPSLLIAPSLHRQAQLCFLLPWSLPHLSLALTMCSSICNF